MVGAGHERSGQPRRHVAQRIISVKNLHEFNPPQWKAACHDRGFFFAPKRSSPTGIHVRITKYPKPFNMMDGLHYFSVR